MILTLPDCCMGDFCPGIDAKEHKKKEDVSLLRFATISGVSGQ
jgi:hypothetical protein